MALFNDPMVILVGIPFKPNSLVAALTISFGPFLSKIIYTNTMQFNMPLAKLFLLSKPLTIALKMCMTFELLTAESGSDPRPGKRKDIFLG
jgi:hypothetical protein